MITREQIEEIQAESREKGISIKRVLQEKGIPEHQYFWWKKKYARGRALPHLRTPAKASNRPHRPAAVLYTSL